MILTYYGLDLISKKSSINFQFCFESIFMSCYYNTQYIVLKLIAYTYISSIAWELFQSTDSILITQKIRMLGTEFPLSVHQIKLMICQLQIFYTCQNIQDTSTVEKILSVVIQGPLFFQGPLEMQHLAEDHYLFCVFTKLRVLTIK